MTLAPQPGCVSATASLESLSHTYLVHCLLSELLAGRYRLLHKIGSGGMASVHEAEDTVLGRRVAVKVLHPHFAADDAFVARFEREARAAASLNHPGIVHVYDVGRDDGGYYIVMELLNGESVKGLVRNGPLSIDQTIDIGLQMAKALDYAHANGVLHRDVKSHNILVSPQGAAKLVDFGIALARGAESVTEAGEILGTVHYIAPEMARGQPAAAASDIYSLGVVLYEMATGQLPFEGESAIEIATRHVSSEPMLPSRVNPRVRPGLERAIMRALAKEPDRRQASAGELARDLLRFDDISEQPTTFVPTTIASRRTESAPSGFIEEQSDAWPLALLTLLAVLLVAGLVPLWKAVLERGL